MFRIYMALLVGMCLSMGVPAVAGELIRLDDPDDHELQAVGFEIPRKADVTIDAVGLRPRYWDDLAVYAWILDSDTREPVWKMKRRNTTRVKGARSLRRADETVSLDPGRYELYLFSGGGDNQIIHFSDGGWSIRRLLGWRDDDDESWRDLEDDLDECYVSLSSDDLGSGDISRFEITGGFDDALIRFSKVGDSEYLSQGFELTRSTNLHLYTIFEHPKGDRSPADFAWIVDADSGEEIWSPGRRDSRHAGGGSKNRRFDKDIALEAGRYVLCYGTDDSHSYEEFNVSPPDDPVNWGVAVLPGEGFDRGSFRKIDAPDRGDPVIAFTRARDGDYFEQAFRLKRDGDIHVYALGEYGYGGTGFVDYAWIVDAKRNDVAWEMTRRNTGAAGGAEKNRRFDGLVHLDAGDYVLYYVTDDSHSFEEWNSATPFDPSAWGVQVFATDDVDAGDIELTELVEVEEGGDVLARLVRVGDHERRRQRFTLDHDGRVSIYALGEGVGGDMYDYGYIIDDDTGRVVWEMDYRDTDHAGGARKNRMFSDDIRLDAGKYEAVYVTDGSHSFEGWNAQRPRDPMNWGMTVRRAED